MVKHNFAMFCKTYSGDIERFKNMLNSFNKFNAENIPLYISVAKNEFELFAGFKNNNIEIITDESYCSDYLIKKPINDFSAGYMNQEICKLTFFNANLAENYLCIDSDVEFIRNFSAKDFMHDNKTPYTVLVQDKDLSIERHYKNFWKTRQQFIIKIYKEIGLDDKRYRTCHGMQVLNSVVLKSLKEDFMDKKGYSYADLLKISPFEFTWYNVWFQKCGLVKEYATEPFFKTFHMRIDYQFSKAKLLKKTDLANAYVGIIMNSNWKKPEKEYKKFNLIHKIIYKILSKI